MDKINEIEKLTKEKRELADEIERLNYVIGQFFELLKFRSDPWYEKDKEIKKEYNKYYKFVPNEITLNNSIECCLENMKDYE